MKKFIYELGPIDFWLGWSAITCLKTTKDMYDPYTEEVYFDKYKVKGFWEVKGYFKDSDYSNSEKIINAVELIKLETGWEGDGRMYVTAIPNDEFRETFCFAIKQGNNGTTFLCSDYSLPHLEIYLRAVRK